MDSAFKPKKDMLHEFLDGRVVGGTLSQLANYSDLFKRMSEAVFLVERSSFRVLECNEAACHLLGVQEPDILGMELPVLFKAEGYLKGLLSSEFKAVEFVYHNSHGDEGIFEIAATNLKILDYIEVIQFIARDVTEVKKAERDLKEMNSALTRLSTTDEMTGLRNYRYFKEVLQTVHHSAIHQNENYGVIFIDVDHFKKFNDRNGHPAGDEVLRQVASILKACARTQDLPARYGGEEFVMVCRHSSLEDTAGVAEGIRLAIERSEFPFGEFQPLGRVTVSIGVSSFPEVQGSFEKVLESADQALYQSKEMGRNRVTSFGPSLETKKKAS